MRPARQLLGDAITDVATGLLVGGGTESTPSGVFYASGCVPHACGGADAFMAVDPQRPQALFRAAERGSGRVDLAVLEDWPADVKEAMQTALGR